MYFLFIEYFNNLIGGDTVCNLRLSTDKIIERFLKVKYIIYFLYYLQERIYVKSACLINSKPLEATF